MNYQSKEFWSDGGCRRNGAADAEAYGSYSDGIDIVRLVFPDAKTNNEAEYRTLKELLVGIASSTQPLHLQRGPSIYVDSRLIWGQMMDGWKVKAPNLAKLVYDCYQLVQGLNVEIEWVSRKEIVQRLGH